MKKKLLAGILTGMMLLQMTTGGVFAEETGAEAEAASESTQIDEEDIESEDAKFGTGKIDGKIYVQEFFGFSIELDDGWEFADEESMKSLSNEVSNAGSESIKEAVDNGTSYLDMYAENSATFQNLNTTITKISMQEALRFTVDPDSVISLMLEPLKEEIAKVGLTDAEVKQDEIEFMGETVSCIRILSYPEAYGGDVGVFQTQVYFQEGTYLCTLTATSYLEDSTEDVLAMCSSITAA